MTSHQITFVDLLLDEKSSPESYLFEVLFDDGINSEKIRGKIPYADDIDLKASIEEWAVVQEIEFRKRHLVKPPPVVQDVSLITLDSTKINNSADLKNNK